MSGIHLLALFSAEKSSSKSANWILAEEMLNCFFGTLLAFNLLFTFFLFAFFTGIWAIAWGILKALYALFEKEKINDWYFLSAQGACAITIGVLLLTNPFMKTWHTIQWTAVLMLLVGLLNLLVNLKNKAYRPGRPAFI
ncbi:hypothetical protein A8C56_07445 [Niabella ginsenosidivorans]|uniref:Uncharacterized protein n=1 Tax=Niabella ginsenosidivorans TaxID=1176587 RepID=A0A1A9HZK0_9BACT|nr:hypothetical protein A8C56_07445 [Niabella ginsenosidivorans]